MPKTLEFDENDSISEVLNRYCKACKKVVLQDSDYVAGEAIVRSFHSALQESASLGNQVHLEKLIGSGRTSLRILALSSQQRRGLKKFLVRFFGN